MVAKRVNFYLSEIQIRRLKTISKKGAFVFRDSQTSD